MGWGNLDEVNQISIHTLIYTEETGGATSSEVSYIKVVSLGSITYIRMCHMQVATAHTVYGLVRGEYT